MTIASTVPLSAKNRAANGSSNDPGTVVSKIFDSLTLHSFNALRQPSTKFLTSGSFQRVRIIPIRTSEPSRLASNETSDSAAMFNRLVVATWSKAALLKVEVVIDRGAVLVAVPMAGEKADTAADGDDDDDDDDTTAIIKAAAVAMKKKLLPLLIESDFMMNFGLFVCLFVCLFVGSML